MKTALVALDVTAVVVAWMATMAVTGAQGLSPTMPYVWAWMALVLVLITCRGLYQARTVSVRFLETTSLAQITFMSSVGWYAVAHAAGFGNLAAAGMLFVTSLWLLRVLRTAFAHWLAAARRSGRYVREVLIHGTNQEAVELLQLLHDHPEQGLRVAGVVGPPTNEPPLVDPDLDAPRFDNLDDALAHPGSGRVSGVIVLSSASGSNVNDIVNQVHDAGLHVHLSHGLRRVANHRLRPQSLMHESLLYVEPLKMKVSHQRVKRYLLDLPIATLVLLLSAPVLLVSAWLIKRDGGPILFAQERVGKNGEPFTLYKLRTMVVDAEARRETVEADNARSGPLFKMAGDPRITPIGRILRRSSIDELPQLFNILRGEMSLIGPRPALQTEVAEFSTDLLARLDVTPGLTGLWQVEARDSNSFNAYKRLDLFYVENWSLTLDLYILLNTGWVVLLRAATLLVNRGETSPDAVPLD